MSAYILNRPHIVSLVQAARAYGVIADDPHEAAEAGKMLWQTNIASVAFRYPGTANLPGPVGEDFNLTADDFAAVPCEPDPSAVLRNLATYDYQSCERPDWAQSQAFAFCEALRDAAFARREAAAL
jgi:hypothetical protein